MTIFNIISLKSRDVSVCIFQYVPYLARDVRDKLIFDPWFIWISICCCKTPQVIFIMQRSEEKYQDATACELWNFLGRVLQQLTYHSCQQVILFSFASLQSWKKSLSRNGNIECSKTNFWKRPSKLFYRLMLPLRDTGGDSVHINKNMCWCNLPLKNVHDFSLLLYLSCLLYWCQGNLNIQWC